MKLGGSCSMSRKVRPWVGLATLLLAGAPGYAQDGCEDCHGEFPASERMSGEYLSPEQGVFARPEELLRNRFVAAVLDRALALNDWRVRIVGISVDEDQPDFAVALRSPPSRNATWSIVASNFAVPSSLYQTLFEERPLRDPVATSLAEYGDTVPNPADDGAVARVKALINARLANNSVGKCQAPIDSQLAERADGIMRSTLAYSRYGSEVDYPTDSMKRQYHPFTFHFSAGYEGVAASRQLIGGRPALMVDAAMAMRDYCQSGADKRHLIALNQALDALEKKLPKVH